MSNVPLPEPDLEIGGARVWFARSIHAHAVAVSAAECEPLMAEIEALRQDGNRLSAVSAAKDARIKVLEDALQAASDAILHIRDMHWTHWTAQEQEEAGNAAYAARDALVPRDTQGDDI